jgi:predicted outer membrane protein
MSFGGIAMSDKSLRDLMRDKKVTPENLTREQKAQLDMLKDKVGQYKDKDASEIMREIDRLKMNKDVLAKLKGKELDGFANTLKPILNKEQQNKLEDLVKYLRKP